MSDEPKITKHTFEMLDTGIAREFGYESDKAFLEQAARERALLPDEIREALERAEAEMLREFLFGAGASERERS
jgi:hypothetical protein